MSNSKNSRIDIIDGLRGLSIILMVIYHALFDITENFDVPEWIFNNPVFNPLQVLFAGLFIFLAGVSSRLSRSNWRRGGLTTLAAAVITIVSTSAGLAVRFGVLHLLAACMLIYALAEELFKKRFNKSEEKKPNILIGAAWAAAIIVTAVLLPVINRHITKSRLSSQTPGGINIPMGWLIGLSTIGFESTDYFPLLPWIFVFMLGAWFGRYVREKRLPEWFYKTKIRFFPAAGRHTMIIYLAHQPVIYGIVMLIQLIKG